MNTPVQVTLFAVQKNFNKTLALYFYHVTFMFNVINNLHFTDLKRKVQLRGLLEYSEIGMIIINILTFCRYLSVQNEGKQSLC